MIHVLLIFQKVYFNFTIEVQEVDKNQHISSILPKRQLNFI